VPFEIAGKDYRHEILDVMTSIPQIQHQYDNLKSTIIPRYATEERKLAYFKLCKRTRKRLEDWLKRLESKFDVDRISLIKEGIPDNFPLANIMLAHAMTLYWAAMILVNISSLHGLRDFPVANHALENDDGCMPNLEIMPFILYIAKSIPFFFQPDAGSICPQTFSFPLGVALNIAAYTNAQLAPEYSRLLKAFSKGPMGAMIQKFLTSLQLLADPEAAESSRDEEPEVTYDKIRHNSELYHEQGKFIQRPATADVGS
jgi:hypothetical protein